VRLTAESTGDAIKQKDVFHLVVVKSTVVPGTTEDVYDRSWSKDDQYVVRDA